MNAELRRLLTEAGFEGALDPDTWSRAVVIRNFGAVPPVQGLPADTFLRHFKLLLLDRRGRPTHFARCGAADDSAFERETRALEELSADPALAHFVPRTRGAASETIRVQVSAFVPGPSFASMVDIRDPKTWERAAVEIVAVAETVGRRAEALLPELVAEGPQVQLATAAAPKLEALAAAGVPSTYIGALRSAFESVPPLRRALQHGDLWPANVIRHAGSWWLIDFAEFANAQVPMYDVFLFVDHTWHMLGPGAAAHEWREASQRVMATVAERLRLGPIEVGGAAAYYLVHLSEQRLHHGSGHVDRAPFMRGVLRLAELLLDGCALEDLPFRWETPDKQSGASAAALTGPRLHAAWGDSGALSDPPDAASDR